MMEKCFVISILFNFVSLILAESTIREAVEIGPLLQTERKSVDAAIIQSGLPLDVNSDTAEGVPPVRILSPEIPLTGKDVVNKKGEKCFSIFGAGNKDATREAAADTIDPTIRNPTADAEIRYPAPEYAVSSVNYPSRGRFVRPPLMRRVPLPGRGFRRAVPRKRPFLARLGYAATRLPTEQLKLTDLPENTRSDVRTVNSPKDLKKVNSFDKSRFYWSSYYEYPDYYYDYEVDYHHQNPYGYGGYHYW